MSRRLDEIINRQESEAKHNVRHRAIHLYVRYREAMAAQNCEIDPWEAIDEMDQNAWMEIARTTVDKEP